MAKTKQQIRILMADDHAIFRDGLANSLMAMKTSHHRRSAKWLRVHQAARQAEARYSFARPPHAGKRRPRVLEEVNFDTIPTRVIVLTAAEDDRDVVRACVLRSWRRPQTIATDFS